MTAARRRRPLAALPAITCAVALAVTSIPESALLAGIERVVAETKLLADEGFIMGGTGLPDPTVGPYIGDVESLYLKPTSPLFPGQPTFDTYNFQGLTTPEQFCPFTACPPGGLTFGDSLTQGQSDLSNAIVPALQSGDNVAAFGYSQSATVATMEMNSLLANTPAGVNLGDLHVVLIGDPNTPIGGILDRLQFPDGVEPFSLTPTGQHVPFVNIPLSLAPTPTGTIPTDIYTGEYDGWANFPQDQSNLLADLNALIGIVTVHGFYPAYTPEEVASAINVGTIGDTNFYMIPENLPILQFMFNGGTAGQFFGDFFSPWARLFIDWGYGNAGDPAVDGLYPIPAGPNISGSPFEQNFGVAGGPWAETPFGQLYGSADTLGLGTTVASSGIAGFLEKMDPLQMLAGLDNAFIQSIVGPWVDVAASAGPLSAGDISTINGVINTLQTITGYSLINLIDQGLLDGLKTAGLEPTVDALLNGPLIPGQPLIDLIGGGFDIFNFFGA